MYIIFLLLLIITSFLFSPLSIFYARKMSIVDVENERSSHKGMAHRGGGILFIVLFYLSCLVAYFMDYVRFSLVEVTLCCGAFVMSVVGWLDDYRGLTARLRLFFQLLIVGISVYFLPSLITSVPVFLEKLILVFAWVWFINLFNFMDGADGFATQETIFICLALILMGLSNSFIDILLCSIIGFLRVNYPRAKIFMGDIGSLFLGYLLGGVMLDFVCNHKLPIVSGFLITSLFSFDATYTLFKRVIAGKKISEAHREHWYQRLLISGSTHKQLFYISVIYNLLMICILFLFSAKKELQLFSLCLLWLAYVSFILFQEKKYSSYISRTSP